jgi:uncharacterized protein (TIGR03435 family)
VVSIKPSAPGERGPSWQRDGGFWAARRFPLTGLIADAFTINPQNFTGVPAWARGASYDIAARMPFGTGNSQFRLMLQALLADRFQFKAHQELRPMEVAILTAGLPGPGRHPARSSCVPPAVRTGGAFGPVKRTPAGEEMAGCSVTMAEVAAYFTEVGIHPAVDETGLKGRYDLDVTIDLPPAHKGETGNEILRATFLAIRAAFQKQLGLNLDFTKLVKRPMSVLVIDHIAPASTN